MKTNTLLALSVVAVGTLFASSAQAGWSVNVSVGGPVRRVVPVYAPAPVFCPPPRVVCAPPRPVCPPVVYVPPCHTWGRYDWDRHDRYGWGRHDRDDDRGHGHDRDGHGHGNGGRR